MPFAPPPRTEAGAAWPKAAEGACVCGRDRWPRCVDNSAGDQLLIALATMHGRYVGRSPIALHDSVRSMIAVVPAPVCFTRASAVRVHHRAALPRLISRASKDASAVSVHHRAALPVDQLVDFERRGGRAGERSMDVPSRRRRCSSSRRNPR